MEHSILVDVKMHKCFPTVISEFSFHLDLIPHNLMEKHIKKMKKNHMPYDTLHHLTYFLNLRDVILNANRYHLKKLEYEYEHLEMTSMWANHLFAGDVHPPHTHSNNFLSGVYYLKTGKNSSPIHFLGSSSGMVRVMTRVSFSIGQSPASGSSCSSGTPWPCSPWHLAQSFA